MMLPSASEPTFSQQVLESSQPVLVYFWAPWCKLCHNIQPLLLTFQSNHKGQFKVVSVNADNNFKLVNTYRIKVLPTVLVFDRGILIQRIEGFYGREELQRKLDSIGVALLPTSA
ncbi:thioredoxin family protein [Lusitaniella coriacea]|nr:thioredoxin family protein [Lusitaniella coriacea]